jgi:hypothetical protein
MRAANKIGKRAYPRIDYRRVPRYYRPQWRRQDPPAPKFEYATQEQADLTPYHFEYTFPGEDDDARIEVEVTPRAIPPTNIRFGLIGEKGQSTKAAFPSLPKNSVHL